MQRTKETESGIMKGGWSDKPLSGVSFAIFWYMGLRYSFRHTQQRLLIFWLRLYTSDPHKTDPNQDVAQDLPDESTSWNQPQKQDAKPEC